MLQAARGAGRCLHFGSHQVKGKYFSSELNQWFGKFCPLDRFTLLPYWSVFEFWVNPVLHKCRRHDQGGPQITLGKGEGWEQHG